MKGPRPADLRLWAQVTATVRPLPGRVAPSLPSEPASIPTTPSSSAAKPGPKGGSPTPARPVPPAPPASIEPNRLRRIDLGREPLAAVIDLHGLDQDRAREALVAFVLGAAARGERTVLVITGKGTLGDGVLRRRAPDWLGEPPLRALVAGISEAHRTRGGGGALYVALKRTAKR